MLRLEYLLFNHSNVEITFTLIRPIAYLYTSSGFQRLQLIDTSGSRDPLHDDSASVWPRDDDAEGHFKKQLLGPLHPSTLQSSHSKG